MSDEMARLCVFAWWSVLRQRTAPVGDQKPTATIAGFRVHTDPLMAKDELHALDANGRIVARIINLYFHV